MANFTAGTTFTDGVTNDVTAAKLNALVADAVPTSNLSLNSTTGTISEFSSGTGTAGTVAIGPSGDKNTGLFFPAADTIAFAEGGTEAMRIDSSGNVGVANTTPSSFYSGANNLVIGSGSGEEGLTIYGGNASSSYLAFADGTTGDQAYRGSVKYDHSADAMSLQTGAAERLRIDSSGNVGIGNTNPSNKLQVTASTPASVPAAGSSSHCFAIGSSGFGIASGVLNTGNGYIQATRWDGTATDYNLLLQPNGGNVGIGTTSPSAQLELSTDSAKKPSTNTWTIASDQRLKTNITNADNDRCYEIVKQVPLKRYTWKSEVYSQEKVKDRSKLGWIAQDVEAVFPKAVGTNRFAYNQVFEDVVTPELDSDGNAVLDENGVAKTKTEKRLVSEDVIEDCKDLNSDQIYAAMYGTIQKLIEKVELLESKVATLEAA